VIATFPPTGGLAASCHPEALEGFWSGVEQMGIVVENML